MSYMEKIFIEFREDEKQCVMTLLNNGYVYVLYALNASANQRFMIGVVLFSADIDGIWINWIGVADKLFDQSRFRKKASIDSFHKSGFGVFLILLTQLRSVSYGWSTNIYLQASQMLSAVLFYTAVRFKKCTKNKIESLPVSWQQWINDDNNSNFYIKFVDTQTSMEEAQQQAQFTNKEPNFDEILHLYKLSGPVKTLHEL